MAFAEYPKAIKTWTDVQDDVDDIKAQDMNEAYAEIIAIEKELNKEKLIGEGVKRNINDRLGYGVEYGLEVTALDPAENKVNISAGVVDMPNGNRRTLGATTINGADTCGGCRIANDLIYVPKDGPISYLKGDVDAPPPTPEGGVPLKVIKYRGDDYVITNDMLTDMRIFAFNADKLNEDLDNIRADVAANTQSINANEQNISANEQNTTTALTSAAKNTAKIKDMQKTLTNLNLTGAERLEQTTASDVVNLPANAAEGGIKGLVRGMTLTNLVQNGDFSNGTNGWKSAWTEGTFVVSNGKGIATGNKTIEYGGRGLLAGYALLDAVIANHKYYVSAKIKINDKTGLSDNIRFTVGITYGFAPIKSDAENRYSSIITAASTTQAIDILVPYNIGTDITGYTAEFDELILIDLTTFGLDDKTAEEMDMLVSKYFDGTQHNVLSRLRSVGKNLFDSDWEIGSLSYSTGMPSKFTKKLRTKNYIRITPNKTYTVTDPESISANAANVQLIFEYDKNKNFIKYITVYPSKSATFTIDKSTAYIKFLSQTVGVSDYIIGDYTSFKTQLEKGSNATKYTPYVESCKYLEPCQLHRLPNDVCDTTNLSTGECTQKVMPYTLQENDISIIDTTTSSLADRVRIPLSILEGIIPQPIKEDGSIYVAGKKETSADTNAWENNIGSYHSYTYSDANKYLNFVFPKGTTLAEAKNALAGTEILYQLAPDKYIVTKNVTSGVATSHPDGTIYAERALLDVGFYKGNFEISRTKYPIKELETLYRVDQETGAETPLDVSNAVIASDGLSFSHPALSDSDLADCSYTFDYVGVNGINTYSYLDDNKLTHGKDGKLYIVKHIVELDGSVGHTATEVQ